MNKSFPIYLLFALCTTIIFNALSSKVMTSDGIITHVKWVDGQKTEFFFNIEANKNNCLLSEILVITSPLSLARLVQKVLKKIQRCCDNCLNIRNIQYDKRIFGHNSLMVNIFPYTIEYYVYMMRHIII